VAALELGCVGTTRLWVESWFVVALELGCVGTVRLRVDSCFISAILCLVTLIGHSVGVHLPSSPLWLSPSCIIEIGCVVVFMLWVDSWFAQRFTP
jgi:hypothetical protein